MGVLQNVHMLIRGRGGSDFFTKNCVRTKWMTPYGDLLLFPLCNITAYKQVNKIFVAKVIYKKLWNSAVFLKQPLTAIQAKKMLIRKVVT